MKNDMETTKTTYVPPFAEAVRKAIEDKNSLFYGVKENIAYRILLYGYCNLSTNLGSFRKDVDYRNVVDDIVVEDLELGRISKMIDSPITEENVFETLGASHEKIEQLSKMQQMMFWELLEHGQLRLASAVIDSGCMSPEEAAIQLIKVAWDMYQYNTKGYYFIVRFNRAALLIASDKYDEYDEDYDLIENGQIRVYTPSTMDKPPRAENVKIGRLIKSTYEGFVPHKTLTFAIECIVAAYKAYAKRCNGMEDSVHLVVDDDVKYVYDSRNYEQNIDFKSCMTDAFDQLDFYDSCCVNVQAASLRDNDTGKIIVRCLIFEAYDDYGNVVYLAERQYGEEMPKRLLIDLLIAGGYIDGYKAIGAGCGDSTSFLANDGTRWYYREFHIKCYYDGDVDCYHPYMDSFKYCVPADRAAYNVEPDEDCDNDGDCDNREYGRCSSCEYNNRGYYTLE